MKKLIQQKVMRDNLQDAEIVLLSLTCIPGFVNGFIEQVCDDYYVVTHFDIEGEPITEKGQRWVYCLSEKEGY